MSVLGLRFRLPLVWPVLCLSSVYALDYPSFGLCYVCPSRLHFRLPLFWPVLCLSFSVYALDYPSFGLCCLSFSVYAFDSPSFGLCYVCPSRFTLLIPPLLACAMSVLLGLRFRLPLFWPVLCLSFWVYALDYPSFGLCYVCPSRFTL